MLTEKDYCDYDTCVALKELGFKQPVDWYFDEGKNIVSLYARYRNTFVPRISLYEAQKFLRGKKKLHITIYSQSQESWQYRITKPHQKLEDGLHGEDFPTYENALLQAIRTCIKIYEQNVD